MHVQPETNRQTTVNQVASTTVLVQHRDTTAGVLFLRGGLSPAAERQLAEQQQATGGAPFVRDITRNTQQLPQISLANTFFFKL